MQARWLLLVLAVTGAVPPVVRGQYYSDRGAVLGGITGALAGAGIGKHNGDTTAGALIGGAVGLVTGAAVGDSMDARTARAVAAERYQQQRLQQPSRAVSTQDVVNMARNGVGEDVMINQIRQFGVQRSLNVQDVIALHRQGVPESVIAAMQQAANEVYPSPPVAVVQQPVVVEEYPYFVPAPPYYMHYHAAPRFYGHRVYYGRPYPPRPSVSWGVTVRN
jgi:outer membrane lipoprotein SlyB